ncbi:uncharacterized protein LOC142170427 [Nicotiana tabacum]|uniref:Uncharacterized protein LOC142170427 n=1 Tax=Nicotiana tabacum TaxID=4097 RepID=A0AC58STY8_TOBAC
MDVGIMVKRRKMSGRGRPRIRWGALTKDKDQELEGQLTVMGAWRSSGDANSMWSTTANYIREAVREMLGISMGVTSRHKGEWWWNEVVQGKVEAKKEAYRALRGSIGEGERRACMDRYKVARKEAKMAVTKAKTAAYSSYIDGVSDYQWCTWYWESQKKWNDQLSSSIHSKQQQQKTTINSNKTQQSDL